MRIGYLIVGMLVMATGVCGQRDSLQRMDLGGCVEYALANNIQIKKSKVVFEQSGITSNQAKAQRLPNLSASASENFVNRPLSTVGGFTRVNDNTSSGNFSVNSSVVLYNGGKISNYIKQQALVVEANKYAVLQAEKSVQMAILQSYLRILYATETVAIDSATLEVSYYQLSRARGLKDAGSMSGVDVAKLEAQYASDKYQLLASKNSLSSSQLDLKQLLELDAGQDLLLTIPDLTSLDVLKPLPSLQAIYEKSLSTMPQMQSSKLNSDISVLETKRLKADYLPKVSLNASLGSGHSNPSDYRFNDQFQNGYSNGVGVSVSIPIYTNRTTKSNVERARLSESTAQLNMLETEKSLRKEVETAYHDAILAQGQYSAGSEKINALQTSYGLIEQQFNLGMKNTLELLTEKNNLLMAKQSLLQSKYMIIMNVQVLNLYQDLPLEVK